MRTSRFSPDNKPSLTSVNGLIFCFLSWRGRLDRQRYTFAWKILMMVFIFVAILPNILPLFFWGTAHIELQLYMMVLVLPLFTYCQFALVVKRLHDLGVPAIGIFDLLVPGGHFKLYNDSGVIGDNDYGPDPLV